MARKLDNPEYCFIISYKSKVSDDIQDLFDSVPITNNTISDYAEYEVSELSSNMIDEKTLFLEIPTQDICHVNIIDETGMSPNEAVKHVLKMKK
ncbi:1859_t:CDS:2 [Diversispora eburnea]|uniref:1859_t:CDS:1 n=1 Tax=Diversispora eburnea TaxID=1213867 RepID=A0A9N9FUB8_9GLOM|nr:1859_t:CDS:2 [Diversispora eburnea]